MRSKADGQKVGLVYHTEPQWQKIVMMRRLEPIRAEKKRCRAT